LPGVGVARSWTAENVGRQKKLDGKKNLDGRRKSWTAEKVLGYKTRQSMCRGGLNNNAPCFYGVVSLFMDTLWTLVFPGFKKGNRKKEREKREKKECLFRFTAGF